MSFHSVLSRLSAAVLLAGLMVAGPAAHAGDAGLMVSDAWVRLAPTSLKTHGGYLTIMNHGKETQELTSASSENYQSVQMHVSRIENGVATMQRLESVEIPAGGAAEFQPGGLHLMLLGAKKPLQEGGTVPIHLGFGSGATLDVEARVIKGAPMSNGGMMHMDHGGHDGAATN